MPDINESSRQLRERLDQEQGFDLDHLFETIKGVKDSREKTQKQAFEYQKEALNLKAIARNAGFDVDYDPMTNRLTPFTPEPPRPSRASRTPDGGLITEENFDTQGKLTEMDPGSKAVMEGYEAGLKQKARNESGGAPAKKPLTESARNAIVGSRKVQRLATEALSLLKGDPKNPDPKLRKQPVDRLAASQNKVSLTAARAMMPKNQRLINSERFRDIVDQLRGSIPFAKGGKALSVQEATRLDRLLEFGPNTSDDTINFNLNEFIREFNDLANLAANDRAALSEEELSQLASDDVTQMQSEGELEKLKEELGLE